MHLFDEKYRTTFEIIYETGTGLSQCERNIKKNTLLKI